MEESERIQKQKELIEYIGIQSERDGYQPAAARILGMLMVMDQEEYTFEEIVQEMKLSKSSVSTALNTLELRGVIEYVTYPGDRKRYFRFISRDIEGILSEVESKMRKNRETLLQIIDLKKDPNSRNAVFLKHISEGMAFFLHKLKDFKAEYRHESSR
ncbi:MAG: MarR family transcriptional regulator [Mangrovibacterium sp.]|nr:MarR family transcriptional regulator [Mangrovibacterium sp.]